MAFAYIEEYAELQITNREGLAVGRQPRIAAQKIAIGGSSTPSVAFNDKTRFIRVHVDAIASYAFGPAASVVAVATDPRMAANATEYFGVGSGSGLGIAVITNT